MAFELPEGTEIVKVIPLTEFLDLVFVLMRVDLFGDEFAGCQGKSLPDKIADYSILTCVIFFRKVFAADDRGRSNIKTLELYVSSIFPVSD